MKAGKILGFAVGPIGAAILGAITLPASTWMFGAQDIGRIAMLQTVTSLLIILFGLGLDQGYLREYHRASNRPALFRQVTAPGLAVCLLGGIGVLVIAPERFAMTVFGSPEAGLAYAAMLAVLAAYCSRYFSLILRMEERGLAFSMSQLLPKIIFLGALLLMYLSDGHRIFAWLLAAHLSSILATTLIFAWNTRHVWLSPRGVATDDPPKLGKLLGFGLPLMLAGLAFWGLEAIDKVMLRYLGSFAGLGIYSVAAGIASIAGTLSLIFTTIWVPTAYRWADEPDCAQRIEAVARKLVVTGSLLVCLAGSSTWLLGFLLPKEYAAVQYLVCACMMPPVLYAVAEVTGIGSGITRKSFPVMSTAIVVSAFNVGANWLLIPRLGAHGAAISTAIAYFLLFVLRTEISIRCWAPMRRSALYAPIAAITAMAVLFALAGATYPKSAAVVWAGAGLLIVSMNLETFKDVLAKLRLAGRAGTAQASPYTSAAD
ncbi:MAG: lipopolysaccharide biosynthesis protein [Steroidobacteraceae bacterium]